MQIDSIMLAADEPYSDDAALVRYLLDILGPDHRGGLQIGGLAAVELADEFGTPCYVYDADVLRRRYRSVVDHLGPEIDVLFALKANNCLAVAKVLFDVGAGADVASAGEILLASRAGCTGERVQFAGPGKSRADLRLAVEQGIGTINLESAAEYDVLLEILDGTATGSSGETGPRPGVAVRVNPTKAATAARMRMGGGCSKFGIDVASLAPLLRRIVAEGAVTLRGLHCYVGTQFFDAPAWVRTAQNLLDLARRLEDEARVTLPSLNFGGGFGVPCFRHDQEFDLRTAGALLQESLAGEDRLAAGAA